jgi:hypothetical protein
MDSEMKSNLNKIRAIEDKYGLVLFRCGLGHLMDMGHQNFDDDVVAENVKLIMAQGEKDKANGNITILTPEYQCEILYCAAELAKFSVWTLFAYIKKYVHVGF